MSTALAAVVLAAGAGTRLQPLTHLRPKALCPVANVPLVDVALGRAQPVVGEVAVNVHHGREQLLAHLGDRVHLSIEEPRPLETAGALAHLRGWIDGRDVLCLNADVWHPDDLRSFVGGWDRQRVRLLVVPTAEESDFGRRRYTGAALLPWEVVAALAPARASLYPTVIAPALASGRAELVVSPAPFFDCGTPAEYLAANLAAAGGRSVIGHGARIQGTIVRSVVWPGATVGRHECLVNAIRADAEVTVRMDDPENVAVARPGVQGSCDPVRGTFDETREGRREHGEHS